jgi:anti-anti-sigma factor
MELTEESAENVTIVAVTGRLDAGSARQLGERLDTLIRSGQVHLLLDVAGVDYIGSMGLRALLVATRLAADSKGRLLLCGLTAPVRRVIDLGGFGDCLEGFGSRHEAMAKFSGG